MFGWLKNLRGNGEADLLRAENENLRRKAAGSLESAMASPGGNGYGNSPGLQREELRHFDGWVHTAIKIIAQRIAAQPIMVGRKGKAKPMRPANRAHVPLSIRSIAENVETLDRHAILDALRQPNPFTVSYSLVYLTIASLELTGMGYWWIRVEDDDRLQIWYLPPSWVRPQSSDDELFTYFTVTPLGSGEIDVPAEEIIRFHYPDPANPIVGAVSPLQAQARAVAADENIQTAQYRAFQNGIHPGMAVIIGRHPDVAGVPGQRPVLTKEQRASLIAALKQSYRGVMNYDEPVILDGLIEDIKKITQTPKELDFLNSGKATKSRILQGFGVNPILAGEIEGANRASATVADEVHCSTTINPKIELLSQTLTAWFSAYFDDPDLLVWIEPARTKDPDAERADLDLLAKYSAVTVNEMRNVYNLAPLADGDRLVSLPAPAAQGGSGNVRNTFPIHKSA